MAVSYRKELRRVSIDVPKEIHKQIVMEVWKRNCTIKKWILRLIVHELKRQQDNKKHKETI